MAFKLDVVKDTFVPDDLVDIKIERVKNQNGKATDKFILYVNEDVFGLLSSNYTYISSKELKDLIEANTDYKLTTFSYCKGSIYCYLTTSDEIQVKERQEKFLQLTKLLLDVESPEIGNLHVKPGIFFVNNYTGGGRLEWGCNILVAYNTDSITIPLGKIFKSSQMHLPSAINFMDSLKMDIPNWIKLVRKIENINRDEFITIVSSKLPKRKLEEIIKTLEVFNRNYDVLYLLACIAWEMPNKIMTCLQVVSELI